MCGSQTITNERKSYQLFKNYCIYCFEFVDLLKKVDIHSVEIRRTPLRVLGEFYNSVNSALISVGRLWVVVSEFMCSARILVGLFIDMMLCKFLPQTDTWFWNRRKYWTSIFWWNKCSHTVPDILPTELLFSLLP